VSLLTHDIKPKNHFQAINGPNKDDWIKAKQREIDNMISHNVWTEVPSQPNIKTIPLTWAYKKKLGASNEVTEFKARICA
jgi:hypothetical protein